MRRIENVMEALECLAYMQECTYSEESCPYFMGDKMLCDNSEIAKEALTGILRIADRLNRSLQNVF